MDVQNVKPTWRFLLLCFLMLFPWSSNSFAQEKIITQFHNNDFIILIRIGALNTEEIKKLEADYSLNIPNLETLLAEGTLEEILINEWIITSTPNGYLSLKQISNNYNQAHSFTEIKWSFLDNKKFNSYFYFPVARYGANPIKKREKASIDGIKKFKLAGYEKATSVSISGNFNAWNTNGTPMIKTVDGWEIDLKLKPGKYLYKFIVDGNWIPDPDNPNKELDGFYGKNSVLFVENYRFQLDGFQNAKSVRVCGSFNNWNERELIMQQADGAWFIDLFVDEGTHAYKFIVDKQWILDPKNAIVLNDGMGNLNNYFSIGDSIIFELSGFSSAKNVFLAGSFNAWNPQELKMSKVNDVWTLPYVLKGGSYQYKFIVDGKWILDPNNQAKSNEGGESNSFLVVKPNCTFHLKGYENAREVILTGSFINWNEKAIKMTNTEDGWKAEAHLPKGKNTYKFIVDGEWIHDPANEHYEQNEYNGKNSVIWMN